MCEWWVYVVFRDVLVVYECVVFRDVWVVYECVVFRDVWVVYEWCSEMCEWCVWCSEMCEWCVWCSEMCVWCSEMCECVVFRDVWVCVVFRDVWVCVVFRDVWVVLRDVCYAKMCMHAVCWDKSDWLPSAVASPISPPVPYYFCMWAVHVLWIWLCVCGVLTDLPTCPYLTVLVRKLASSMGVCPYFSKCGHKFPESMEIVTWAIASLFPAKLIIERWWGVIVRWHLHISSHLRDWNMQPVLIGQKSLLNQWTSTLH